MIKITSFINKLGHKITNFYSLNIFSSSFFFLSVKGRIRGKSGETSTRGGIFVGEETGRKRGFDRGWDSFKTGGRPCRGYDAAVDLEPREDRDVDAAERTIDENPVPIAEISINQSIVTESKTEFQQIVRLRHFLLQFFFFIFFFTLEF